MMKGEGDKHEQHYQSITVSKHPNDEDNSLRYGGYAQTGLHREQQRSQAKKRSDT
jgi:hypothetical protein